MVDVKATGANFSICRGEGVGQMEEKESTCQAEGTLERGSREVRLDGEDEEVGSAGGRKGE